MKMSFTHYIKERVQRVIMGGEKYFKTDMLYIIRGGSWLTLGQGFVSLSAFLLAIAFANLLPRDAFGTYRYIMSVASILGAFTLTGLGAALIRAVAQYPNESLKKAFWVELRWGLWVTAASLTGSLYYAINGNDLLSMALIIIGIFSPISQSAGLYLSFLNGKRDFKRKSIYDIFYNALPALAIFITLFVSKNPLVLVSVYFISYTSTALFFFLMTLRKYPETSDSVLHKETVIYGKHLSIMNLLNIGASQIDKILVFHYLGAIQLAIYAFSMSPISQISSMLRTITVLSFPKFSSRKLEEIKEKLPEKLSRISIPLIFIVTVYIITAPYIYKFLFPQYMDAVIFSQVYALSLLFFPKEFMHTAMMAHSKEKLLYTGTISSLLVRIILLMALLPTFGVAGAIGALLLSGGINNIITNHLFKKM